MQFRPGQLVFVDRAFIDEGTLLKLYNVPGGFARVASEDVHETGWLRAGSVALVVFQERTTSGEVYLVGPHGGGWGPAAFLKILREAQA